MEHPTANAAMKWLAAPMMIVATAGCSQEAPMNVETLKAQLSEALPTGSTAQQVADYLNTHKLTSDGPVAVDQLAPVKDSPGDTDMLAIVRKVRSTVLVSTDLQMRFIFDPEQRLKTITVREVHTGL